MWLTILPYLRKYAPHLSVVFVLLAIFIYWCSLTSTIDELRDEVVDLRAANATQEIIHKSNVRELTDQLYSTNLQVTKANLEYETLNASAKAARASLENTYKVRMDKMNDRLALLDAIPTPETCDDAVTLLIDIAESNPWPTNR